MDSNRADALTKVSQTVPPGEQGEILIDTGASITSIDEQILLKLGIPYVGDTEVRVPTGKDTRRVYWCGLAFPGSNIPSVPKIMVMGGDLASQGIIGLFGRDLLANGVLIFNGLGGHWTFAS